MITALVELVAYYGDTVVLQEPTSCIDRLQKTLLEFFFRVTDDNGEL